MEGPFTRRLQTMTFEMQLYCKTVPNLETLKFDDLLWSGARRSSQLSCRPDTELFAATSRWVIQLQDYGGTNAEGVVDTLRAEEPKLVTKFGPAKIDELATLILEAEI